jgi:hypothetical protein
MGCLRCQTLRLKFAARKKMLAALMDNELTEQTGDF